MGLDGVLFGDAHILIVAFYFVVVRGFVVVDIDIRLKEMRGKTAVNLFLKNNIINDVPDTKLLKESLNEKFENNLLTITNRGNVVEAYFCDEKDFNKVLIAICGYRLHFKIYTTNLLKREVEVHFCTKEAIKDDFSNSFVWRNWKELEEKFNKEYFFDVKKGVINERGELLVEVNTTKLKKFAPISAIAIIKIINKDGNELGAYKDLDDTLKLYNDSVLERLPQNSSPVKVGYFEIKEVKRVQLEEGCKCLCKQYDLIWGNKVSCEFRKKVVEIAKRLGKDPNLLMAGMALETGTTFSPTAGKGSSYVGLIQFGKDAAKSIGTTQEKLLKMNDIEQLDYV